MIKNNKEKSIAALKRARSMMGKMMKMMEAGECCENIMNQNVIAVGLLRHASRLIMENDLNDCLKTLAESKNQTNSIEMTEQIKTVTKQFIK